MGWSSGSELMSRVISSMVLAGISSPQRTSAYRGIIAAFHDADCDTLDECYGMDPAFDAAITGSSENDSVPVEPDSEQIEKTNHSEDRDWDYFTRINTTVAITARDFISDGGGILYRPPFSVGEQIDISSVIDSESVKLSTTSDKYVVELRSDDNEHLTVEWLDSVRPALGEDSYAWQIAAAKVFFDVRFCYPTMSYYVCICDETFCWQRVFNVNTRGEVRAICRALKAVVPL